MLLLDKFILEFKSKNWGTKSFPDLKFCPLSAVMRVRLCIVYFVSTILRMTTGICHLLQILHHLPVAQLLERLLPGEGQDLPERHSKGPDVTFRPVLTLQEKIVCKTGIQRRTFWSKASPWLMPPRTSIWWAPGGSSQPCTVTARSLYPRSWCDSRSILGSSWNVVQNKM